MKKFYLLIIGMLFLGTGLYFFLLPPPSSQKILRVMTYSSFVNIFGPGQEIQKEFEKICSCRLKWIKVPDSTLFVQRLSLKKNGFKTDVVVGLDQLSLKTAQAVPWKKTKIEKNIFTFPASEFLSDEFIPYDWSPMSFLSRKKRGPLRLKDLLREEFKNKISLPSPRTSTVGFQFYYWIWFVFKENTDDFLKSLKHQLYGMSPSWSTSYALFQRGHVHLSFSYLSSLLYHLDQNQKDFYPIVFKEGHPFQVELAAVSGFCTQCDLAQNFVRFLLKPEIQSVLNKKNYMLPVLHLKKDYLRSLPKLDLIKYEQLNIFLDNKEIELNKWDDLMK